MNPAAPKGGRITHGVVGTFDSLNPFIVKGLAPTQIRGYVIESLMARGYDEPFTLYGLLAHLGGNRRQSKLPLPSSSIRRRSFSDGKPVTAADVIFSWEILRDKGRPNYRTYYAKVAKAEALSERTVRFDLTGADDRELPLILGLMPVLAKHAIDPATFEDTTLKPIVGSGPYVIADVRAGDSVTLKRDPNYWGRDLAIHRGFWNFEEVRTDFYRDANSQFEAFKKGLFDVRTEHDPGRWETGYDVPAVRDGRIVKEQFPTGMPKGMSGMIFNTRRPIFADIRVREAIGLLFDFEWVNHNFFFDRYKRTASYFEGSELAFRGHPADAAERALLAPFAKDVRPDVMDGTWAPPVTDGSGRDRETLKRALDLLDAAGFELVKTVLRDKQTKTAVRLRISRHHQGAGAARDRVLAPPQAGRHHPARARRRRGPIRPAAHLVRLRHDRVPLGPVAVARQRTGVLLGRGGRRRARHAQLHGREEPSDRRHDRGAAQGPRARRIRLGGARARPPADLRVLRGPAVSSSRAMGGALDHHRASGNDLAVRLSAGNMVAAAMILGDPQTAHVQEGEPATLDDLFRQAAARRPDAIALCDPPNRLSFTDGEPRRLTYAQADHIVSAIAGRLRRLGLATDSIVALQLPNTAESVLALLGVLRAGLIAAPLPLLWRRIDAAAALNRVGARAIMTSAQHRRNRSLQSRQGHRGRGFPDPLRLQLRREPARRSDPARRSAGGRAPARSACPDCDAMAIPPLMSRLLPSK